MGITHVERLRRALQRGRAMLRPGRPATVRTVGAGAGGRGLHLPRRRSPRTLRSAGFGLPAGLTESSRLPEPIFTPSTKAETGHDENITFEQMVDSVGRELSEELRRRSISRIRSR